MPSRLESWWWHLAHQASKLSLSLAKTRNHPDLQLQITIEWTAIFTLLPEWALFSANNTAASHRQMRHFSFAVWLLCLPCFVGSEQGKTLFSPKSTLLLKHGSEDKILGMEVGVSNPEVLFNIIYLSCLLCALLLPGLFCRPQPHSAPGTGCRACLIPIIRRSTLLLIICPVGVRVVAP